MDELEKGLSISIDEAERAPILKAFQEQIADWGMAMPPVEPLVLDFGLGRFEEIGLIEYWIANEIEAGYCGKYLFVFDGQTCPSHRHREKLETFFIVKGTVEMRYGDHIFDMGPGAVLRVEPWTLHSFTGKGRALLLEVSKPCVIDDNYFENAAIPIGGNYQPQESQVHMKGGRLMTTLHVDLSQTIGNLKPLHGLNNGPIGYGSLVDVSHYYKELRVPYVRLHDTNWPHPREVDIPQVFRNFDADPDDPASYDFARTDAYIQKIVDTGAQIVYRLGVSIEHTERRYYTAPPADFDKWARICLGIVKHYNYGWAAGYRNQVAYWEIWNEADIGDRMWSGTIEQYFELYETTAKMLKAYDPDLKVGGPATAKAEPPHPAADFLAQFLAYCEAHDCPLDFVSWHRYATNPNAVTAHAHDVRKLLERYGYANATSHLNEWNYVSFWGLWDAGNEFARRKAFERQKNEEGASYIAATLALMQDLPIDIANYYDGQPSALFCGIFDYYGVPQKAYYAFKAFRRLLDYPDRLRVTATPAGDDLRYLAAGDPSTGAVAILVSRFAGEPGDIRIELAGMQDPANLAYDVQLIDKAQDFSSVQSGRLTDGETSLTVAMDAYSVALITVH